MPAIPRFILVALFMCAAALLTPGCATRQIAEPVVTDTWDTHMGQLMYRGKEGRSIIGEFVVRRSEGEGFVMHFSSGPGIPLIKLQQSGGGGTAEGVLARGKWRGRNTSAPGHLRSWLALQEVFFVLPSKGSHLQGPGWTAEVRRDGKRVENVAVTFGASGESFVFHFSH